MNYFDMLMKIRHAWLVAYFSTFVDSQSAIGAIPGDMRGLAIGGITNIVG